MNWDQIGGRWLEFKGRVREQWGRLTDDDLDQIAGKRDRLLGTLQRLYGKSRETVEREVEEFVTKVFGDREADTFRTERADEPSYNEEEKRIERDIAPEQRDDEELRG